MEGASIGDSWGWRRRGKKEGGMTEEVGLVPLAFAQLLVLLASFNCFFSCLPLSFPMTSPVLPPPDQLLSSVMPRSDIRCCQAPSEPRRQHARWEMKWRPRYWGASTNASAILLAGFNPFASLLQSSKPSKKGDIPQSYGGWGWDLPEQCWGLQ